MIVYFLSSVLVLPDVVGESLNCSSVCRESAKLRQLLSSALKGGEVCFFQGLSVTGLSRVHIYCRMRNFELKFLYVV